MKAKSLPKKMLGQHFLTDNRVLHKIVAHCQLHPYDFVVEIGPGQGVLTRLLTSHVQQLTAVEKDHDLILPLQQEFFLPSVNIVHADFLKWPIPHHPGGIKVVGNIPYYISTPIIEKIVEQRAWVMAAFLTVQLEFGRRLAAQPGSKEYGSLSCFIQYYAEVKVLFKINSACFNPKPKVDSCFVSLQMRQVPLYRPKDEQLFFKVIHQAFSQRRKTISNTLAVLRDKKEIQRLLERLGVDPKARAEDINLEQYVEIADGLII